MKNNAIGNLDLSNVVAVENGANGILGHLMWYTITEQNITRNTLVAKMQACGFDEFLPREISPSDAFRRSTAMVEKKRVATSNPNIFLNYLVREVFSDRKEIIRHIVIEEIDKGGKKLDYEPKMAKLRYDKEADKIDFENPTNSHEAQILIDEALANFDLCRNNYNARHLREILGKIMGSMTPTIVRPSGGVYFVPRKYEYTLRNLVNLVNSLEQSEAFKVPLIDSLENRDMVKEKLKDNIIDTIKDVSAMLKNGLHNEKVTKFVAKQKFEQIKAVMKAYKEYEADLELAMENMEDNLKLLSQQGERLLERIQESK